MGTWGKKIKDNDTTLDIYTSFFERYNSGESPEIISKEIKKEFSDYFEDSDDRYDALIGLALAQWETKSLEPELFKTVKQIVENHEDLEVWKKLGANEKALEEREKELKKFLNQISKERSKAKRRMRPKFEYSTNELVRVNSPDNKKEFVIQEEFTNGKYVHTSGSMNWFSGGGAGILYFDKLKCSIRATWLDSKTIEIAHEKNLNFTKRETKTYFCGDEVMIRYKSES
jgi:hypothetical protein